MLKVFIADDEESIRNGLKKIIDWKDCGYSICGEAGNGQEAFEKISELNPDLVLLDIKMPGLTGVEVLKKIAEQNAAEGLKSKTNFLILSGFSDFEFAKEAMNYGAQGYFVKPIDEDLLEEKVRSIAEHFSQVKEIPKSEDIKRRFEQMFLFGVAEDAFEDDYEDENDYQVALFSSKRSGYEGRISDFEKRIADTFSNMDMFTVAYEEDVAAVFKNCKEDAVYRMLERFAQRLSKNPFAVLGSKKRGVNGALASFMECRREVPALFFADDGKFADASVRNTQGRPEPFEFEKQIPNIVFCIETYDKERLAQILEDSRKHLSKSDGGGYKPDAVKTQCIAYIIELQSHILKKYPEREFPPASAFDLVPQILSRTRFCEVFELVENLTTGFLEAFHTNTANSTIIKVIQYIKTNYANELKLETLGDLFYCNSAYLGKKFKEYTGVQFNVYLDKIRIEEAKKKLTETDLKVYQISKLVGYSNTDYFFMKFRKYTGMTPKEFKQEHGSAKDYDISVE